MSINRRQARRARSPSREDRRWSTKSFVGHSFGVQPWARSDPVDDALA